MMNKDHDKKQALRQAYNKKMTITDGNAAALASANDLTAILGCSKSYAYKAIKGASKLSKANYELLQMRLLGTIPGIPGYYLTQDGIEAPNGYKIQLPDMEHLTLIRQMLNDADRDRKQLEEENAHLVARIEWLKAKLEQPERLRKFAGGPRVIRFDHSKKAKEA